MTESTSKGRGYGFVAFREKSDAEQAIHYMHGEVLGGRAIRVNWANQKQPGEGASGRAGSSGNSSAANRDPTLSTMNSTVYVGNLAPDTTRMCSA